MTSFVRRITSATSMSLILATAVLTLRVSAEEEQPSGTTVQPVATTALSPASPVKRTVAPLDTAVPAARPTEKGEPAPGMDPDPDAFDREGMETWWQHYQRHIERPE